MKPRGRPKLAAEDTSVQFNVRLPSKQFDDVQRQADEGRMTMADWVRLMLERGSTPRPPR